MTRAGLDLGELRRLGIVRHQHWLLYGYGHGHGMWLPDAVQHVIVAVWNRIACTLMGHGHLVQEEQGGPCECVNCCRAASDRGSDVIRSWEFEQACSVLAASPDPEGPSDDVAR